MTAATKGAPSIMLIGMVVLILAIFCGRTGNSVKTKPVAKFNNDDKFGALTVFKVHEDTELRLITNYWVYLAELVENKWGDKYVIELPGQSLADINNCKLVKLSKFEIVSLPDFQIHNLEDTSEDERLALSIEKII